MAEATVTPIGWERALMAAEKVKERLQRAVAALEAAGVPYAVVGGNAVAEWVARVDEGALRNTRDVDLLLRRADFEAARVALEDVGFVYNSDEAEPKFVDGPDGRPNDGVHIFFAGENVKPQGNQFAPDLDQAEQGAEFQVIGLKALVTMKLVANRCIDTVHLRDLIGVGLLDATWPARLPPPLGARLQQLLDDPEG